MNVVSHVGQIEAEITRSTLLSVGPTVPELLLRREEKGRVRQGTEKSRSYIPSSVLVPETSGMSVGAGKFPAVFVFPQISPSS